MTSSLTNSLSASCLYTVPLDLQTSKPPNPQTSKPSNLHLEQVRWAGRASERVPGGLDQNVWRAAGVELTVLRQAPGGRAEVLPSDGLGAPAHQCQRGGTFDGHDDPDGYIHV